MIALLRIEFVKQLRRARTMVTLAVLLGIPLLLVAATKAREDRPRRRGGRLFGLATQSGLLMPAIALELMSFLLLLIIAAMFSGDSIAGEAASGNLRYVLLRPVSRVQLALAKLVTALTLTWIATAVMAGAALAYGAAFFGWNPVTISFFGSAAASVTVGTGTLLSHVVTATAYVGLGVSAAVALGLFFSTVTDSAGGAIGATIGTYVVSRIIDGIEPLGVLRYGLPTHYSDAWSSMFTDNTTSHDLVAGAVVQLVWFAVFSALAVWWFARKDIKS